MANKKIIKEGIITSQLDIGTQTGSGTITYDQLSNSITIASGLNVAGSFNVTNTINVNVSDNIMSLNVGEQGNGVTAGGGNSGIEIDRGSYLDSLLVRHPNPKARFVYNELQQSFIAELTSGAGRLIVSTPVPTSIHHLTNKSYVDTKIASEIVLLNIPNLLSDLSNVTTIPTIIPPSVAPATGLIYNNISNMWEPQTIPPGISSITINVSTDFIIPQPNIQGGPGPVFDLSLQPTTVVPGSYVASNITVDANGRITSATDGNIWNTINTDGLGSLTPVGLSTLAIKGATGIINTDVTGNLITINLNNTSVTPGSYINANISVDSQGRITTATNGSGVNTYKTITGTTGSTTANSPIGSLSITGQNGIATIASVDNITVSLGNTTVIAGIYTNANITIDPQGRITTAANGTSGFTNKIIQGNSSVEVIDTGIGHVDIILDGVLNTTFTPAATKINTILEVTGDIITAGDIFGFSLIPSDIKLKTNIKTLTNSLDIVKKLRGVSFNMISSGESSIGVIAQELRKELPELVSERTDGMLAVRYAQLTGLLIEAIKTLELRVSELERSKL